MVLTLTSKRQNHKADFFQIMCASQKVWTLHGVYKLQRRVFFFFENSKFGIHTVSSQDFRSLSFSVISVGDFQHYIRC